MLKFALRPLVCASPLGLNFIGCANLPLGVCVMIDFVVLSLVFGACVMIDSVVFSAAHLGPEKQIASKR